MPTPVLSTEESDDRAHQMYNEGQYDEALDVLREGLGLYPNSVEHHIGVGYAHHAREDYAWARRSFERFLEAAARAPCVRVSRSHQGDMRATGRADVVHPAPRSPQQPMVRESLAAPDTPSP